MTKINRLNIFSLNKFQSILFELIGLILGIIYSLGVFLVDALVSLDLYSTTKTLDLSIGRFIVLGSLLGMPFLAATV